MNIERYKPSPLSEVRGVLAKFQKTQADLAEAIGRCEKYVSLILTGKRDPKLSDCKTIYRYFKQLAVEQGRTLPSFDEIFND